jgi:hypothetical protein
VQLPADVAALYPAGTLFGVAVNDAVVELRPELEADAETPPDVDPPSGGATRAHPGDGG